jgi:hypothetical protein
MKYRISYNGTYVDEILTKEITADSQEFALVLFKKAFSGIKSEDIVGVDLVASGPVVYRHGKAYGLLSEVKDAEDRRIRELLKEWTTVDEIVTTLTKEFSEFTTTGDKPYFNQGGLDPKFCVTIRNPGFYVKSGAVIFRKRAGSDTEFKLRSYCSLTEVQQSEQEAMQRGKFIFQGERIADNNRPGFQEVNTNAVA